MNDTAGIKLASSAQIGHRLAGLVQDAAHLLDAPSLDAQALHRLRVTLKKLRAWSELQHQLDSRKLWQKLIRRIRRVGRFTGASRDRQVMLETLQMLLLKDSSLAQADNIVTDDAIALVTLPRLLATPLLLKLTVVNQSTLAPALLLKALQRSYIKAQRLYGKCSGLPFTAPQLHRLRQRIKTLYYQLHLTSRRSINAALLSQLEGLGKALGQLHDLAFLHGQLHDFQQEHCDDASRSVLLQKLLDLCEQEAAIHLNTAMDSGRALFSQNIDQLF